MQIINLSAALSLLAATAFAADCFEYPNNRVSEWEDLYWDIRAKVCGNTNCAYQQPCSVSSAKSISGMKVTLTLSRKRTDGGKGYADCWGATEDIINQCVRNQKQPSGWWSYNGQQYNFDALYTAF